MKPKPCRCSARNFPHRPDLYCIEPNEGDDYGSYRDTDQAVIDADNKDRAAACNAQRFTAHG